MPVLACAGGSSWATADRRGFHLQANLAVPGLGYVGLDTPDNAVAGKHDSAHRGHGISAALMSYVQLDEPVNDQPVALRVPGLDPGRRYQVTDVTPGVRRPRRAGLTEARIAGLEASGAALAEIGLAIPAQRALTALVILIETI